jgi:hypothetical protein
MGQYVGIVAWSAGGGAHSGLFEAGTVYTATATLTATSGWTFSGVAANAFSHTGATSIKSGGNGDGTYTVTIVFPATTSVQAAAVTDINLSTKVPSPVRGGTPVTYFSAPQYTGTVSWTPAGVFASGTVYWATVTLTAASGWTFSGVGANAFTHTGASGSPTNSAGSGTVNITFPVTAGVQAQVVTDRVLTYNVPRPLREGTPPTSFAGAQYAGTIVWWEKTGSGTVQHSGVFQAGTEYRAEVTLYAMTGWTFEGVPANSFGHGQAATITHPAGSGSTLQVSVTFPATAGMPAVTDLALTYNVPAPVKDGTPVWSFAGPQYVGFVTWEETNGGTTLTGLFADSTAYTAKVTLYALAGYTFTGVGQNAFSHGQASEVSNNEGSGGTLAVTIKFLATITSPQTQTVTDLDLTNKVPSPVTGGGGGTPVTYFSTRQNTGNIAWTKTGGGAHSGLFQAGTPYTATVTLSAAPGWTFNGVTFTHTGGGTDVYVTQGSEAAVRAVNIVFAVPVTDLDLTPYLAFPVPSAVPASFLTGNPAQYTGTVTWNPTHSAFTVETEYIATVNLTANVVAGWTFKGFPVSTASFTRAKATSVTHAAGATGGMTVTVVFPPSGYNATGGAREIKNIGGTIYEIHTFTSDGTLAFNTPVPAAVAVLVVAGGGGGGFGTTSGHRAGGGGAGGYYYNGQYSGPSLTNSVTVKVGAGGAGGASTADSYGGSGGESVFGGIIAKGGGGGAKHYASNYGSGNSGGSGGGATYSGSGGGVTPGSVDGTSTSMGNRGGNRSTYSDLGTGGGGAGGQGADNNVAGGAGAVSDISGTPATYAAGGAAGADHTGNGGGGGPNTTANGGKGGSGIVIVRWEYVN